MQHFKYVLVLVFALSVFTDGKVNAQYADQFSGGVKVQSTILPEPTPPRNFGIVRSARRQDLEREMILQEEQEAAALAPDQKVEIEFEDDVKQGDDRRAARPAFGAWPRKGIRAISLDVRDNDANQPEDRSDQLVNSGGSEWTQFAPTQKVFAWAAPNIRYQPLYFEDVALERYGQSACSPYRQSVLSGYHFFKSLNSLPFQMAVQHPQSCDYPLGFCRPGNKVDYTIDKQVYGRLLGR